MALEQIRILCYGDSNTWGHIPLTGERYSKDIRWTGVLQKMLGDGYIVIEDGLQGRTTDLDDPRPERPGKNGKDSLMPSLQSNNPLDIVVLMLGTNDLKTVFDRTTDEIAESVKGLIEIIKRSSIPNVLIETIVILLSPPLVDESKKDISEKYFGAGIKSKELAQKYEKAAQEFGCGFLDVAQYGSVGADGVHLDADSHKVIGAAIAEKIVKILLNKKSE